MKKLICDRCKAELRLGQLPEWAQAPAVEYRVQYIRLIPFYIQDFDLCQDCQKKLGQFLSGETDDKSGGDGDD